MRIFAIVNQIPLESAVDSLFPELALPRPDVLWLPDFLPPPEQKALFDYCQAQLAWEQKYVVPAGTPIAIPRLLAWFGDVPYAYSGVHHPAKPMPAPLAQLKQRVEAVLAGHGVSVAFNSVLLNYYRDGNDSIGMHADDESQLGEQPVIASVSLGAARTFKMVHVATKEKLHYHLTGGALLVMKGNTQAEWRHGIPKEPGTGPRINLTFRKTMA